MTIKDGAGAMLIVTPIWFNVWFAVLARRFDYPDILRRPSGEILARFRAAGSSLILTWWAFMVSGGLFVASAVLLFLQFGKRAPIASTFSLVVGVLAGLAQVLGLLRWVYLVPALARIHGDPEATEATRAAAEVSFRAFHQYLGVGVGEHLGALLTGAWTGIIGVAILRGDGPAAWLGWVAMPLGVAMIALSAESLGPFEERGWGLAGSAAPFLYIAWSLWMLSLGIDLVI